MKFNVTVKISLVKLQHYEVLESAKRTKYDR